MPTKRVPRLIAAASMLFGMTWRAIAAELGISVAKPTGSGSSNVFRVSHDVWWRSLPNCLLSDYLSSPTKPTSLDYPRPEAPWSPHSSLGRAERVHQAQVSGKVGKVGGDYKKMDPTPYPTLPS